MIKGIVLYIRVIILGLTLFTPFLSAKTATETTQEYFTFLADKNFAAAADYIDEQQLKEFRDMMSFYKELPNSAQQQFAASFFGTSVSLAEIAKVSDRQFFSIFLGTVMKQFEGSGGFNFDKLEILGEVAEGEEVMHLVTRNQVSSGEVEMEQMEVISLQKRQDKWFILLSGKIKGIPQRLKAAFSRYR